MEFWKNYEILCKNKGKSPNAVAKELGISSGSVTAWKNGRIPQNKKLALIANYFDVPIAVLTDGIFIDSLIKGHETFISYQNQKDQASTEAIEKAFQNLSQNITAKQKLAENAMEQALLEAFRATSEKGKMSILEAALKAKFGNNISDTAIIKENK